MDNAYLRKFDEYSYEIAPKQGPYGQNIEVYEGDEISLTLKGIHLNTAQDPFDFGAFNEFNACFALWGESETYCSTSSNFVLGQTQNAIDYDNDQGNPAGSTQDELHFLDPSYEILSEYPFDEVMLDIQGKISNSIYTFMKFKIDIINDITK